MTATVADILIEALPYIRRFYGRTIVIKYGGHAMVDPGLKKDFARDITLLKFIGLNPVVVHGGGPQIGSVLEQMGIRSRFVDGMRVTDEPTMDVVEMVLVGNVNKAIVSRICQFGGNAVGLSGKDGGLLLAEKMQLVRSTSAADEPPEIIDMGMVGDVVGVNPEIIRTLEAGGFIPVIAPVGVGKSGETYNINADWVACKIALSLHAIKFMLLTDVEGLLDKAGELISSTTVPETERLLADGSISGGMIPKMRCALEAAKGGVDSVHIIDGRKPHAVLLELFTDRGIGTQVTDDG
jgi:acetylglutamate kinase